MLKRSGNSFRLLQMPLRYLRLVRLDLQLLVFTMLVVAIVTAAYSVHEAQRDMRLLTEVRSGQALILGRAVVHLGIEDGIDSELNRLQQLIDEGVAEWNWASVSLINSHGEEVWHLRSGSVTVDLPLLEPPPQEWFEQTRTNPERVSAWVPFSRNKVVEWIRVDLPSTGMGEVVDHLMGRGIGFDLVAFFLLSLALLAILHQLILRRPMRAMSRAIDFAGTLDRLAGRQIESDFSSLETHQLIEALNKASYSIHEQERTIQWLMRDVEMQMFAMDEHSIVIISDPDGRVTYANNKFCQLSRFSLEEIVGRPHRLFDDDYYGEAFRNAIRESVDAGEVWHGELRYRRKGDGYFWANVTVVPFADEDGRPYQIVEVSTDVTPLREAEEELRHSTEMLRHAQQLAQLGNWEWVVGEEWVYWSPEILKIFAMQQPSTPISRRRHLEWIDPDDRPRVEEMIRWAHHRGGAYDIEYRINLEGDAFKVVREHGEVYAHDEQGNATLWRGTIQDITRSKMIENQLRERTEELEELRTGLERKVVDRTAALESANRELERLNQVKTEFVSIVSHELRSPLTSIKSFTEILRDDHDTLDSETRLEFVSVIDEETDRLARLINDLLDLQRIDSGKMVWRDERQDLRAIVESTIHFFTRRYEEKGLSLSARLPQAECPIIADGDKIKQVITNLLSNAWNHTNSGGVVVSVERPGSRGSAFLCGYDQADIERMENRLLANGYHVQRVDEELASILGLAGSPLILLLPVNCELEELSTVARMLRWPGSPHPYIVVGGTAVADINAFDLDMIGLSPVPTGHSGAIEEWIGRMPDFNRRSPLDGAYCISVEDTGVGVPEEQLGQIFERFYQVNRQQRTAGGSGLGLAISREIVDHYHGRIWVESVPGEGSIMMILLPPRQTDHKPLGQVLLDAGMITPQQLEDALKRQRSVGEAE